MAPTDPLELIYSAGSPFKPASGSEACVRLPPSPDLARFAVASAAAGLSTTDALRLALERALVLADVELFGIDRQAARYMLGAVACESRPYQALGSAQARYVRALSLRRAIRADDLSDGLTLVLAEHLLVRASRLARSTVLDDSAVEEMIAWQLAATLEGRTMGEWALKTLAARHIAA
jgi:hypothetical protein